MNKILLPHRAEVLSSHGTVKTVSASLINTEIIYILNKNYKEELSVLNNWILSPDYRMLSKLRPLIDFVKSRYEIDKNLNLYRGFSASSTQNKIGLTVTGLLKDKIKNPVGQKLEVTIDNPTSFTSNIDIAKEYGDVVVKTVVTPTTNLFPITDELNYIVQHLRNSVINNTMAHQFEYIVLPSNYPIELEVIQNKTIHDELLPPARHW